MIELQYHTDNWFITLTYNDENIPLGQEVINPDTGEIIQNGTLAKKDLQNFWKRLRKAYPDEHIMYYAAGEYGSQSMRPHYHAIVYGLPLDDLKIYKVNPDGFVYYNSPKLEKIWSHGFVVIAQVTWETCAYTARYIMKKQYGDAAKFYEDNGIYPEFTNMSLKPAIGKRYYEEHGKDIFKYDSIAVRTPQGGRTMKPPRYYERLYDVEYPSDYEAYKQHKKEIGEALRSLKMSGTSLGYLEQLVVEEHEQKKVTKSLKRKDI